MRVHNHVQPSYSYGFGFPTPPSYTPTPAVYQQPTIPSYFLQMAQAQQTLFQGWASFGAGSIGGGFSNFSSSLGFAASGAFPSFGGSSFGASSFGSMNFGTNSTDLSSVFGSLDSLPSFGLSGGHGPFAAGLQNIQAQMFAIAGKNPATASSNPFDNPFTSLLQNSQQQLVNLTFRPQPFF